MRFFGANWWLEHLHLLSHCPSLPNSGTVEGNAGKPFPQIISGQGAMVTVVFPQIGSTAPVSQTSLKTCVVYQDCNILG